MSKIKFISEAIDSITSEYANNDSMAYRAAAYDALIALEKLKDIAKSEGRKS